jgi:hypothetical protein
MDSVATVPTTAAPCIGLGERGGKTEYHGCAKYEGAFHRLVHGITFVVCFAGLGVAARRREFTGNSTRK